MYVGNICQGIDSRPLGYPYPHFGEGNYRHSCIRQLGINYPMLSFVDLTCGQRHENFTCIFMNKLQKGKL